MERLRSSALLLLGWPWRQPRPRAPARWADRGCLRHTASGPVVGFATQHETHAWRGILFAAPPVGDLRWGAPREALEPGSPCPRRASFGGAAGG